MINDTTSTGTQGTTIGTKEMFYHGNFKSLWPFPIATATSIIPELSIDRNCSSRNQQAGGSDATTTKSATSTTENQQQQQLEMGESSCSTINSEAIIQPQHFDAEFMCMNIYPATSSSRTNTSMFTNNSNMRVTTIARFNTLSCLQCKDMIHAIVSRSFYSLASISMIIMNKSIDKR